MKPKVGMGDNKDLPSIYVELCPISSSPIFGEDLYISGTPDLSQLHGNFEIAAYIPAERINHNIKKIREELAAGPDMIRNLLLLHGLVILERLIYDVKPIESSNDNKPIG